MLLILSLSLTVHVAECREIDRQEVVREEGKKNPAPALAKVKPQRPGKLKQPAAETEAAGNRWGVSLGPEEKDLLARITMLEAGGEPDEGQQAVAEVILNRIWSDKFPNTVYEVLSQKTNGRVQFTSWKRRNAPAAEPSDRVRKNVERVLNGETHILPFETVYFSVKGENEKVQIVIGHHVFCNQY